MLTIAIDGPCGAGKSSVAKALSKRLGVSYFNTGDIYRTCALFLYENKIDPNDDNTIDKELPKADIEVKFIDGAQHAFLNGKDVTDMLHNTHMSAYTMQAGKNISVRNKIVQIQRSTAKAQSVVMEGRDIGAVILPDANYKFFVTAKTETRAKRMLKDLLAKGEKIELEQVIKDVEARDYYDYHKPVGPLIQAEDSILIETDDLDLDGVIDLIVSKISKEDLENK